jgi:hypothetical protein
MLGWMVRDVINTRDEDKGLMQERLYVDSPPLGTTKLSDWVRAHREKIGRQPPANCSAASIASALTSQMTKTLRVTANPRRAYPQPLGSTPE